MIPSLSIRLTSKISNLISDYLLKIVIIGNPSVGKSSILLRYTDDIFSDMYITTIGVDFKIKGIDFDGTKIKLQIWDSAGQERFRKINSAYYKGAQGIILVYDITDQQSFDSLSKWIIDTEKYTTNTNKRFLIGNKCDLANKRQVTYKQGKEFADKFQMNFLETSAKNSVNIEEAFITLTKEIVNVVNQKTNDKYSTEKHIKGIEMNKKNFSMINKKE